jgi:glycine/D-amino acid oxidase-like deaminating enzyme
MAGLHAGLPCFRVPDDGLYGRAADDRLLLGGWEPRAVSLDPRTYSLESQPPPVEPDWSVLGGFARDFAKLWPQATCESVTHVGRGWPTFTPDGRFIIGPSRRIAGFVMAGGCNAHGISGSPGIGQLVVESMLDPNPSDYVRSLSPDRFTETTWAWDEAIASARRVYETYYQPVLSAEALTRLRL